MIQVVVIEDDRQIAALHNHFIAQEKDFQVLAVAASLANARDLIRAARPDLVIIDNYLPDGLGIELLVEMNDWHNRPECIVITAANDAQTVQLAHRYRAFDYLIKPVDYQRLAASLQRFARSKAQLNHQGRFRQSQLDELFQPSTSATVTQEGKNAEDFTLRQIVGLFPHTHVEHSASDIAAYMSVSTSTARRYLDKAVEKGTLEAFLAHGKVGRPTRVYRLPSGQP